MWLPMLERSGPVASKHSGCIAGLPGKCLIKQLSAYDLENHLIIPGLCYQIQDIQDIQESGSFSTMSDCMEPSVVHATCGFHPSPS